MGLLDLFSSESETSNQTTSNTTNEENTLAASDNRATDSGNIGGNVTLGKTSGNVDIRTTDYGALEKAGQMNLAALDFGSDALESMEGVSSDAIVANRDVAESAIDLSGDSLETSLNFGGDALDSMEEVNRNTVETMADSFNFWNQQTTQNIDRSLAFADRANRSEGAAVLESGLKTVATVGGIIGGTIVLRELFK